MKEPSVRERFVALAVDVAELMTPEAFAAYVKVQSERYSRLIPELGMAIKDYTVAQQDEAKLLL